METKQVQRYLSSVLLLGLWGLIGGHAVGAQEGVAFFARRVTRVGDASSFVTVGNFNSDGRLDLALAGGGNVTMLLGQGDGTFQVADLAVGAELRSVTVGDFNGDGRLDLVTANGVFPSTVAIRLGQGDGTFQAARDVVVGDRHAALAVGDFNGDGRLDLVTSSRSFNTVSILRGRGDGTFQAAQDLAVGANPASITVGDFNGDGRLDLAMAIDDTNIVAIRLGQGDGTFQAAPDLAVGDRQVALTVGDFNGDGRLDLARVRFGSPNIVAIRLGQSDGTFQAAPDLAVGFSPVALTVGDFNGDSRLDLAIVKSDLNTVSILLGQGDGTFQAAPDLAVGAGLDSATVGDFNGDGRLDLATVNIDSNNIASNTVSMLLGQGDGTFQVARALGVGGPPFSVAVSDFNSDGHLDLATGNRTTMDVPPRIGTVSILLGQGDGTFRAAGDFFVSGRIPFLTVGDFNADGRPDLVTQNRSNFDSDTVSIFLGRGDGTFQAALDVAAGDSPGFVTVADFNADGRLDLAIANFSGTVSIRLGQGDGTFQAAPDVASGDSPSFVTVADFNADSRLDLAVLKNNFGAGSNTVSIFLGQGDGTFRAAPDVAAGASPRSVTVADFNADGRLDLAVINNDFVSKIATVSILLGRGNGTFRAAPDVTVEASSGSDTVGDFNADGRLDLVFNGDFVPVSILLGRGDGTFRAAPDVAVEASPSSVTSAVTVRDFNADGRLDLAVVNTNFGSGAATVSIFLGRGDGTFQAARHFGVDSFASFITVVDFNADGRLDLAVANSNSNTVSILLNTTPAGVVNHLVAFVPLRATQAFTTARTGCPAGFVGTFRFTARLTNRSVHSLTELGVAVTTLTNGALLQNAVGGPGGVGARLSIPATGGFSDGVLRPAEGVEVPFVVCLRERRPFRLEVDVLGVAVQDGGR